MEEEEVQDTPLPHHRERQSAMATLTRAGKRYYILVHGDKPSEVPVHSGMVHGGWFSVESCSVEK